MTVMTLQRFENINCWSDSSRLNCVSTLSNFFLPFFHVFCRFHILRISKLYKSIGKLISCKFISIFSLSRNFLLEFVSHEKRWKIWMCCKCMLFIAGRASWALGSRSKCSSNSDRNTWSEDDSPLPHWSRAYGAVTPRMSIHCPLQPGKSTKCRSLARLREYFLMK